MEEHPLARANGMMSFLTDAMERLLEQRIRKQRTACEDSKVRLQQEIQKMAEGNKDGKIVLCYSRSEYITKSYYFYMAYYEGEMFVDDEPECQYIDMSGFMDGVEEDFEVISREIEKKYIRVTTGEKEYLCEQYMDRLYREFMSVLKDFVYEIKKEGGIALYYGGYMEETALIGYV